MKGLNSSIIILSYDLKNMLYIGSACMENKNAGHHLVGLLEDALEVQDKNIDLFFLYSLSTMTYRKYINEIEII